MHKPCMCEHSKHFEGGPGIHDYQQVAAQKTLKTDYGTFSVCNSCAKKCSKGFNKNSQSSSAESFLRGSSGL